MIQFHFGGDFCWFLLIRNNLKSQWVYLKCKICLFHERDIGRVTCRFGNFLLDYLTSGAALPIIWRKSFMGSDPYLKELNFEEKVISGNIVFSARGAHIWKWWLLGKLFVFWKLLVLWWRTKRRARPHFSVNRDKLLLSEKVFSDPQISYFWTFSNKFR